MPGNASKIQVVRRFHAAPWSTSLKVVSLLGTIGLGVASYVAYHAIPTPLGFTRNFGFGVAAPPPLAFLSSLFFVVSGYSIDPTRLSVERLITSTSVPLTGLTRVWFDPNACKGSIRVFGNGGLFSFSGWFYSKRLGRYRLFATDFRKAVVLSFPTRNVVISPAAPQVFIEHLHHILPDLIVGREESSA